MKKEEYFKMLGEKVKEPGKEEIKQILGKDYLTDNPKLTNHCSICRTEEIVLGTGEWQFPYAIVTGIPASVCKKCNEKALAGDLLVAIEKVLEQLGYNDPDKEVKFISLL